MSTPADALPPHDRLRAHFRGPLIFACPEGEAGESRGRRLRDAARSYDLVELDAGRDLDPDILAAVPAAKRLIAWHGPADGARALADLFGRLAATEARYYRLVVDGDRLGDGLATLEFLRRLGRRDVIAYAAGEAGLWSRVLSPQFGAPLVFGALGDGPDVAGEPSTGRLIEDFGLPEVPSVDQLYAIVGGSVSHSLSPRLHNGAYRQLGLPALFVPVSCDSFGEFWRTMIEGGGLEGLDLPLCGLTVAAPHKVDAASLADDRCPVVARAGAANLLTREQGLWVAESSDPQGVLVALGRLGAPCAGRRAAVVGCGGSGRAVAVALAGEGADVVLVNRGRERGEWASDRLGLPLLPLAGFSASDFDLIVHATPVGRLAGEVPFDLDRIGAGAVIVDLVYAEGTTPLAAAARACGAAVIDGRQVLLIEVMRQFARMTGHAMPESLASGLIGMGLGPGRCGGESP